MNRGKFENTIETIVIILITILCMSLSSNIIYTNLKKATPNANSNIAFNNQKNVEKFNIYDMDAEYNEKIYTTIDVPINISIKEKLDIIATNISNNLFDGKAIKVLKVKNNIAYIDLIDLIDSKVGNVWYQAFQGSTGAVCTSYKLLENLLQEYYNGDWIDGVYITYNGKVEEMDHLGEEFFGEIIYRNPKYEYHNYTSFDYIDINDYIIEFIYNEDINLDGIDDEVMLIHKGKDDLIYYDPMIYIVNGLDGELLTAISINPFNPKIDKIEDLNGDGIPDINIKFNQNGNEYTKEVLYEYKDGVYVAKESLDDEFNIYASASSYFWSEFYNRKSISYKPKMVLDSRPRTSWIEGVEGNGIGEWIQLDFGKNIEVNSIYMLNGLGDVTGEYYFKNNRVKKVLLEFSDGEEIVVELDDSFIREQEISIDKKRTSYIKFTILDVYKGSKFDDTCIGSISINNPRIHNYSLDNNSNKEYE